MCLNKMDIGYIIIVLALDVGECKHKKFETLLTIRLVKDIRNKLYILFNKEVLHYEY